MTDSPLSTAGRWLLDRRRFLRDAASGLGGMALASLLVKEGLLAGTNDVGRISPAIASDAPLRNRPSHFEPRAKQVLVIFCSGACSHLDTWDFKPELIRRDGQPMPGFEKLVTFQGPSGNLARSPYEFKPRGETGKFVSELLPNLAQLADEMCFIHSMTASLIMLSAVYRQSSRFDASAAAVDAGDRLLWRYPPRRLEAEPIRDAILAVSGVLDRTPGGPGYDPFEPNTNYVHVYTPKSVFGPAEWRRMVYQQQARMQPDSTFGAFDCPDASQVTPKRNVSTTALQALNLLNSPFVVQQAEFFAKRLVAEAGADPAAQIRHAFRLAFGREPAADELAAAGSLVERHGLEAFCRAVFNANEFVYVD